MRWNCFFSRFGECFLRCSMTLKKKKSHLDTKHKAPPFLSFYGVGQMSVFNPSFFLWFWSLRAMGCKENRWSLLSQYLMISPERVIIWHTREGTLSIRWLAVVRNALSCLEIVLREAWHNLSRTFPRRSKKIFLTLLLHSLVLSLVYLLVVLF